MKRIQQIPNPLSSFLLGWKDANVTETGDVETLNPPPLPPILPNVTNYSHYKSEGLTVSSTVFVPTADGGQRNVGKKHAQNRRKLIQRFNLTSFVFIAAFIRFVRRQHSSSFDERSQNSDRRNFQVDEIPVRTIYSPHLLLERQGICIFRKRPRNNTKCFID
jgi:hypothetical protein